MKVITAIGLAVGFAALTAGTVAWSADLAKVNGKVITDQDIKMALGNLNEGQRDGVLRDVNSRRQVLASVIDQELLVDEAEKEGLDKDDEFKTAAANFRKQYLSSKVLQKNLQNKLTESSFKKYYNAHKERYSTDQVHAMHILVSSEDQARDIMKQAKEKNTDDAFQDLAEKYSRDPSAKNNRGDLGFFGRDRMVEEFTSAAFAGNEGEIVGPVKTSYGYHIIRVVKKKPGHVLPFGDVELKVRNDYRAELTRNYIGNVKKSAKVEVDDKAIEKM